MDYTLYGGELSLFTGKARAYMRYKGLDYVEKLATMAVYKSIILLNIGAPIIPVLQTSAGEFVQDTTEIIDFLEARHPSASVYPEGPLQRLVALLLECYGDEWLVIPAMHYRWSVIDQQADFIYSEFGKLSAPDASFAEQVAIGQKTSAMFSGMTKALGITEDTIPGIEQAYNELLAQLQAHFSIHDYLLGSRPSIGDFGFIGPLYAHLGRDPVPKALMQEKAPAVYAWVERMNNPQPLAGEFLADDQVPDTLLPVLQTLCADYLPDVLDVVTQNAAYIAQHPGEKLPRALGMHAFTMGSATGERFIHSYAQWMFQRPLNHYQALQGEPRQRADQLLKQIGGYEALQVKLEHSVKRVPGQLELVAA